MTLPAPGNGTGQQWQARCVHAVFLFVGPDGELTAARDAAHVTVGVTPGGRVRLLVPDGLGLAPAAAARLAELVAECVQVARDNSARFASEPGQQGVTTIGVTAGGLVHVIVPADLDMAPDLAAAIGRQIARHAQTARDVTS
jgi:hypothetical protein